MNAIRIGMLAAILALSGFSQARSAQAHRPAPGSDRERFVGAWQLVSIASPTPNGKTMSLSHPAGMLIYTRDGHMSVQLMYPSSANAVSNEYVLNGYEASFGSYDVNEATHALTHHIQGSNTRDLLVGKGLRRVYQFSADGNLIIKSARSDEHWSVTWKHYRLSFSETDRTGSWQTPVRGRNVQFDHLGISGGRIRANNRGVVFHP